jgi:hypothetical protein
LSKGLHGPSGRKGQVLEADVHPQPDIWKDCNVSKHKNRLTVTLRAHVPYFSIL